MKSGSGVAKIFLYGFILIFCAIGLGLLYGAIATYLEGETSKAAMMLVAGLAFGGFGLGLFALVTAGFRRQERQEALRTSYPDEPWRWRDDWAAGRIHSNGKSVVLGLWGFTILWNIISIPLAFLLPEEVVEKGNTGALVGLLFPLVGIGLLVAAIRKTIQQRKYGSCLFLMESVPGTLGGEVAGSILLPRGLPAGETLSIRLSCIHRQRRGSGKNASTHEDVLWQAEQPVARLMPTGDGTAQSAQVKFQVPYDTSPTAEMDSNNSVYWKLEAEAAVPGVDFAADFEVPVYKTSRSSPVITEERLRTDELSFGARVGASMDHTHISIVPGAGGGMEFVLGPREGVSGVLPAVGIIVIFTAIVAFLLHAGAPFIFPLVFGGFTLIIVFALVFGVFGESRVVVEDGHVSVRNSLFGIMMGKRMQCSSVTKISVKGQGKAGKRGYYSITLTGADGRTVSPFQFLADKDEADWLAEAVRRAMEPWRSKTESR